MLKQQSSLLWTRGCSSKNVREAYSGSLFSFFIVASSLNLLPRKVLRTTCVHQTVQRGLAAQRQKSLTREIRLWDFRKPVVQGHGLRLHAYIYIYTYIYLYLFIYLFVFFIYMYSYILIICVLYRLKGNHISLSTIATLWLEPLFLYSKARPSLRAHKGPGNLASGGGGGRTVALSALARDGLGF